MPIVDLLVIGGGIHGACVARDAGVARAVGHAGREGRPRLGDVVPLLEADPRRPALPRDRQFGLVHEALREREILLRTAPTLVRPLDFVLPFYEGDERPPWMLRAGLTLYDLLAGRGTSAPRRPRARRLLAAFPFIPRDGLHGGAWFADAQMDDALLVVANALDAVHAGATIRTDTEVTALAAGRAELSDGDTIERA
jgi:glycerol-3-phosphate dehydrogenase